MKIRMKTIMAGPDGVVLAGQIVDLPAAKAIELLNGGYAHAVDPPATETATIEPQENAMIHTTLSKRRQTNG